MENQNSVCFSSRVTEVISIEGADNIEQCMIGGWSCITKKGEYKPGDMVIVATTDAVIPLGLSSAMGVQNYLRNKERVRTVKLKGVFSECLIIPKTYLPIGTIVYEGMDLMKELNISKYEPPVKQIQLGNGKKIKYRDNQNFHVYYKFPNLKNVKGMFTEDDLVQITRKLHGTNARYGIVKKSKLTFWDKIKKFFDTKNIWIDYEYIYGSHNVEKGSDSNGFYSTDVWRTIAEKYNIKEKLWNYIKKYERPGTIGSGLVIYGEIYGPGIQKNYDYGLKELEFNIFDHTIDGKYQNTHLTEWLSSHEAINLPHVPILFKGEWNQEIQDQYTFDNFIEGTKIPHEGIVIKALSGDRTKVAKCINPSYLIYGEKHDVGDSH
jgi:RNA ligase (TIGR02306 family)